MEHSSIHLNQTDADKKKKKRSKSGKRKHKHHHEDDTFNIPGVIKIVVGLKTQQFLGCVVGETITAEKPWKVIKKDVFEDHLDVYDEESEFLPYKEQIIQFPKADMLFGYVPDESREYDEFYMCLTEEAHDKVAAIIDKMERELAEKLNNAIYKTVGSWESLGTEEEVDDEIIKNNRPLIEVEVETDYPIMKAKVRFKFRQVQDVRDGYAEILAGRKTYVHVQRRRIDAAVQVSAQVRPNEAQTICTFPTNAYTQYEYACTFDEHPSEKCKQSIQKYLEENIERISNLLQINGCIDLYINDYAYLGQGEARQSVDNIDRLIEYASFTDIDLCKGKVISHAAWHPMWTGTIAVSYTDECPSGYRVGPAKIDEVSRAVYGVNPVLIWSFLDGLSARLLLDAHREVVTLAFCPYDENLLVGGCTNGQVIIWDIRHKMQHVEEEEILTNDQQRYRTFMFSLMEWMKNIKDIKLVPIAAVSNLEYSHRSAVTRIVWLPNYYEISKTGQLTLIPEDREDTSLQFATSSEDGTVLFWDLLARPTLQAGSYRPQRRLRRLKKRPSALEMDVSPFRILNRLLKPSYRIDVKLPQEGDRSLPLSYLNIRTAKVHYVEKEPDPKRTFNIADRIMYEPVFQRPVEPPKYEFCAGSPEGDLLIGSWEGYDYNTGELINSQSCTFLSFAKYHDGPITSISRSRESGILLTVGGRIFCIWNEEFRNKPILLRRSRVKYTHGCWNLFRPSMIKLTRTDGNLEIWDFLSHSCRQIAEQTMSGSFVTGSYTHPLRMKQNVIGVADSNGSLRVFYLPQLLQSDYDNEADQLCKFFDREVERRKGFLVWQDSWIEKHALWIKQRKEEALKEKQRKVLEEKELKEKLEEEQAQLEKEETMMLAKEQKAPPGKYEEWAREQWKKKEEDRMIKLLLAKKHLNRDDLEQAHGPIKRYEEDKARKKQKQEERLAEGPKIFHETVAMLFPDVMKEKPPPPPDPYAGGDSHETKREQFNKYQGMTKNLEDFIEQNPFLYKFDWKVVLLSGRERRNLLTGKQAKSTHLNRHLVEKLSRKAIEDEEARLAQIAAGKEAEHQMTEEQDFIEEDDDEMDYGVIVPEEE